MAEGAAPVLMSWSPPVPWVMGQLPQDLEVVLSHIRGMMTFSCIPRNRGTYVCHSGGRWSYGSRCTNSTSKQFVLAMGSNGCMSSFPCLAEGSHPK